MTTDPSDTTDSLHDRLVRCDQQALAELFTAERPRLWRMVHFRMDPRVAGRVDVDDVLQEAFLAATKRLVHYGGDGFTRPFLWLRLVARQTLVDVHRRHLGAEKRDAGREVPIAGSPYGRATSVSMSIRLVGDWTSPSQAAARGEAVEQVQEAIAGMDDVDQEVLALRHFEELTNSEVAETLGIQPKAASIRYVRALRRLKEILAAAGIPAEGDSA